MHGTLSCIAHITVLVMDQKRAYWIRLRRNHPSRDYKFDPKICTGRLQQWPAARVGDTGARAPMWLDCSTDKYATPSPTGYKLQQRRGHIQP